LFHVFTQLSFRFPVSPDPGRSFTTVEFGLIDSVVQFD